MLGLRGLHNNDEDKGIDSRGADALQSTKCNQLGHRLRPATSDREDEKHNEGGEKHVLRAKVVAELRYNEDEAIVSEEECDNDP